MATEFKLPDLGENIEAADVVNVLISAGDTIEKDQPVLEVETDKAVLEVPSSVAGKVVEVKVAEGDKISVGQLVFTVEETGGAGEAEQTARQDIGVTPAERAEAHTEQIVAQDTDKTQEVAEAVGAQAPAHAASEAAPEAAERETPASETSAPAEIEAKPAPADRGKTPVFASPSVRQFAREIGVDVYQVKGSGPGGRISEDDVKRHARQQGTGTAPAGAQAGAAARPAPASLPDFSKFGAFEREKMSNVRRKTAEHMELCWSQIPHVTIHDKVDLTEFEALRQRYKARAEAAGGKLTLTAMLLKVVVGALKAFPRLNASIDMANGEIVYKKYYHLGVAADTDRGLVVPVVRDVERKSMVQIASELTELAEKARNGKLGLEEMQGASFTVTNLGGIGIGYFTPIVNYPEVAILGVGRAVMEPVFIDGEFQPRLMMPLSLSIDHRLVDGADGARFLRWIVQAIQEPMLLAVEG